MKDLTKKERVDQALSLSRHAHHVEGSFWKAMSEAQRRGRGPADEWVLNSQFVIRKRFDPNFRREANRQVKGVEWVHNHIISLSYIILRDIFSAFQLTEKDLYKPFDLTPASPQIRPRLYGDEREVRRLIREYYPQMFPRIVKPSYRMQKIIDEAEKSGKIVLGPFRPSRPIRENDERMHLIGTTYLRKSFDEEFFMMDYADSLFVFRLEKYWADLKEIVVSIQKSEFVQEKFDWLLSQIVSNDYAVAKFLQDISTEVERRWFGNLTAESRTKMVSRACQNYTPSEAKTTIQQYKHLCETLTMDSESEVSVKTANAVRKNVFEFITNGALDYARHGFVEVGKWLFEEAIRQKLPMNELDTATCHHNLAVFDFLNNEFTGMFDNLQMSLEYWKANNSDLRIGIDEGYRGVAYRQLGNVNKATESWSRSRSILTNSSLSPSQRICSWMEMAHLAAKIQDLEWTEECLYSGLKSASSVDSPADAASYFIQTLANLRSTQPSLERLQLPKTPCYIEPFSQGNLVSLCGPDIHLH